ncbi:MAG: LssY C-terminal domain-containing protein, partial [Paraburkholderia tropica]
YRVDMKGERREPMTLQWAASAADLSHALRDAGWSEGTQFSVKSVLSLVAPNVDALSLPLLPKLNNGQPSPLVFARLHLPDDPQRPGSRRDVLRFWPTGYALASADTPIWVGSLVHERLRRASWPFNVLTTYVDRDNDGSDQVRRPDLAAPGEPPGWRVMTMPGSEGCEGRPVMLVVSGGR